MDAYKLDTLHYYTASGMSWDALLKQTKINFELLTDIDMHLFIEKMYAWRYKHGIQKACQKQTILILQIIILRKKITTSCFMMQTTSMAGE